MSKSLEDYVQEALEVVREVSCDDVTVMMESGEWLLLDVREPNEYSDGHIFGARNVPRGFLEVKADLVHFKRDPRMEDRNQKVICYCGGGHRSALAAKVLQEMGFNEAVSLKGGWRLWTAEGKPVCREPC